MSERRYTDEEVSAIFAAAAEDQSPTRTRSASPGTGLTLSDLQDIGRQAGIPAEAVAHAARALDAKGQASTDSILGLPFGVGRTVELPRKLSDREWEQLVGQLRQVFRASGTVRSFGPMREWRNGNLHVLLEPTDGGERLRLHTMSGPARANMLAGAISVGFSAALAAATAVAGQAGRALPGIVFLGLVGVGMMASGALRLPSWSRRRARQMEAIAEKVATDAAAPPSK
jgi:hypothetical protein